MAISDTQLTQVVELLEEVYDQEEAKREAIGTFTQRVKDAKNTLEFWAKENDITPGDINTIYETYKKSRNGKITWSEEDGEFGDLLFNVMEKALSK